jgi:hypothetical protein
MYKHPGRTISSQTAPAAWQDYCTTRTTGSAQCNRTGAIAAGTSMYITALQSAPSRCNGTTAMHSTCTRYVRSGQRHVSFAPPGVVAPVGCVEGHCPASRGILIIPPHMCQPTSKAICTQHPKQPAIVPLVSPCFFNSKHWRTPMCVAYVHCAGCHMACAWPAVHHSLPPALHSPAQHGGQAA